MDAIKKKMQAMKVEKDNAMDRSDVCEQAAKDAKVKFSFEDQLLGIQIDLSSICRCGLPRRRRRWPSW